MSLNLGGTADIRPEQLCLGRLLFQGMYLLQTQTSNIDNVSCSRIYKALKVIEIFMKQYNFQGRYWKPSALSELTVLQRT